MDVQIITPPQADETNALEHGLVSLTEAISQIEPDAVAHGALGGEFGYGARYENDVFVMRPFYWGECDCGSNERGEKWHAENPHSQDCFQTVLHQRFAKYDEESGYNAADAATHSEMAMEQSSERTAFGTVSWSKPTPYGEAAYKLWRVAYAKQTKAHERLTKNLYKERGLKPTPYQWYCTCGIDEKAKEYFADNDHSSACALELPNFHHKQSGLEVRWYKWIGRDTELKGADGVDFQAVFSSCLSSLASKPKG